VSSLPTHFAYLHGEPTATGLIRTCPEDFQVSETLGFEPEGEGEHVFLYIQKRGENTDWVARQLANFAQRSPRDVSYAGKKDRHAVTQQWFCVKFPIKRNLNWKLFNSDSIQVLKVARHPRKLRLGALQGNCFRIRLREISNYQELTKRINLIKDKGVPNYFGEQRFGNDCSNLEKGIALLKGQFQERQRHKKGLYISAVRSWLFNQLLTMRIQQDLWDRLMPGDALMIAGSHSCFVEEVITDELVERLAVGKLSITGPLWGKGDLMTTADAREWEYSQLLPWKDITELLDGLSLRQERRAFKLQPTNLLIEPISTTECWLEFELPAGAFATSVLREICRTSVPD